MSETKVMLCSCDHKYQDKKFGKNKRVFNQCSQGNQVAYRCTVCERVGSK